MTSLTWYVQLVGAAQLAGATKTALPLERKAAALLAYLALEGPTRRAQLAELLWPETREAAARNNLVHLLRKLRAATGVDLVPGAEVLSLEADLMSTDVLEARAAFLRGDHAGFLRVEGEVLHRLTYDDCPDLDDWVTAWRERLSDWRCIALRTQVQHLEAEGQYDPALVHALTLLDLDPVSEEAWRGVMRLHYLRGDRPAALRAYHACKDTLWRELEVAPLPETVHLAREIDRGTVPVPQRPTQAPLPLAVLRPPVLVGREREWAQMEEAWGRGQFIFVSGEPGVGKTRLARDFAFSKGECMVLEGRPGDATQPGSSSVRSFRRLLQARPDVALEPWVRREMSRYLPELALPSETLPPLSSHADLVRFRQAMAAFAQVTHAGYVAQLVDDWQFFDEVSIEDGMSIFGTAYPLGQPGGMPVVLATFRRGELSEASARLVEELVRQDMALLLELQPLAPEGQDALLAQLGVPAGGALRERLRAYAGGNPLFVLETVRHLTQSSGLEGELPARLLPTGRVEQLIARRLARLSPSALQAARAAAVLQSDFSLEQVAEVLGAPLLGVAEAWEELEGAQITQGERFAHDLMAEAVAAGTPETVRRLLHRSAARALAAGREPGSPVVPAARIAHHWQEGGQDRQAAPWLLAAGRAARNGLRLREATAVFRAAAEAARKGGEPTLAFEALRECAVTQGHLADRAGREEAVAAVVAAAHTPLEEAQAAALKAELHGAYHEAQQTEDAARQGLAALELVFPTEAVQRLRTVLEVSRGTALWLQGQTQAAADAMACAVAAQEPLGESAELAANLSNLGVMLDHLDRHREATRHHRRACALFERHGEAAELSGPLHNLAVSLLEQGEARAALAVALRAHGLESRTDGDPLGIAVSHSNLGRIYAALGQFSLALHHYALAGRSAFEGAWYGAYFAALSAEVWLALGRADLAEQALVGAHDLAGAPGRVQARILVVQALIAGTRGEPAAPCFVQAQAALGDAARPLPRAHLALARARLARPEEALELAGSLLADPGVTELGGVRLTAHLRVAGALLTLGQAGEALPHAEAAWSLLETLEPEGATRGEALAWIALVRRACGAAGADAASARAEAWVRETAEHHVPPEARSSFAAVWPDGLPTPSARPLHSG